MCYTVNAKSPVSTLQRKAKVHKVQGSEDYTPPGRISGFAHPILPVITEEDPDTIQLLKWGLIPSWAKEDKAAELAKMTLNAREDTVFEKPSFKGSILGNRCILLIDGFYEWRHEGSKKIPHYITLKEGEPFALGCIYATWKGRDAFSIITTDANPMMEYIHNTKKRMPFVLPLEHASAWLKPELTKTEIKELMQPLDEDLMKYEVIEK
ncbi:SOS response-associated peptidase [Larkinella terrae]|uniref:Abasic site processing protein n=1 Tax=Larkinella terrae TaxID=2025311 RepID=A0A7K0EDB2_9BACT|nr:SOS response-associated peptidase [Larkinella terrae]MRS59889.1 SOS response-associated peptidase [Larkinella terrae]